MNHFEIVQSEAMGHHGIFTFQQAKKLGIVSPELARWSKAGRILKVGHGVYRLASYPAEGVVTDMASLLAAVGDGSYLYGESVLGFLELCPTRSYVAFVATPNRVRKKLGDGVVIVAGEREYRPLYENGIPCQRVVDAVLASIGTVEQTRLFDAIAAAEQKGYLEETEARGLKARIESGYAAAK